MAENTTIEWTDSTWCPTRGCSRISPGCGGANHTGGCYAEKMAARFSAPGLQYHGFAERTPHGGRWTGKVALIPDALTLPLRWRKPRRIFVNSMSDLFHEALSDSDIDRVFAVMALADWHVFQLLTKRSARMLSYATELLRFERCLSWKHPTFGHDIFDPFVAKYEVMFRHIWLGVSVEDRARKARIDDLRNTPAAVRFLSLEPLLEDLGELNLTGISQVIVGAESGPRARLMQDDWVRNIRDQCVAAEVPFMFKQRAVNGHKISLPELDGRQWAEFPVSRL